MLQQRWLDIAGFPSPDGELVGLDWVTEEERLMLQINAFPSPDGELVGLDN